MDTLTISDLYRETAVTFLNESNLFSVLQKYGRIEFEGAYAGNVMLHGDVDIKIIRNDEYTNEEIFTILRDIHDTCKDSIRSLFIKADWDDPRFGAQYPYGKYIGLKTLFKNERWKFDIWFISDAEALRDRGVLDISKINLTAEQRSTILGFKAYRKEHKLKISGQEIYEAVLKKGHIDAETFFKNITCN
ncbi:MAG: hypothetical protein RLZZ230_32 [Candidatus Parcubacteria bacterium]|jgi:hypothetical protein